MAGEFDADAGTRAILADAGLPEADRMLVRRELSPDGRGRAFVEDEPASVRTLARLGERLVAIHGQSSEQELADRGDAARAPRRLRAARRRAGGDGGGRRRAGRRRSRRSKPSRPRGGTGPGAARPARLPDPRDRVRPCRLATEDEDLAIERRAPPARRPDPVRPRRRRSRRSRKGRAPPRTGSGEAARAFAELAAIDPREAARREEAEDLKDRIADLAAAARDAASGIEADPDRLTAIESRLEKIERARRAIRRAGRASSRRRSRG